MLSRRMKNRLKTLFSPESREPRPEPLSPSELTRLWNETVNFGAVGDTDVEVHHDGECLAAFEDHGFATKIVIEDSDAPAELAEQGEFHVIAPDHFEEYADVSEQIGRVPTREQLAPLMEYLHTLRTSPDYQLVKRPQSHVNHPALQETFGLSAEEYAVLLGDETDREARITQICELSLSFVGHLNTEEIHEFFHTEVPIGAGPDLRYIPRRVPLDVAAEPGGLKRVVAAARDEVGRRIHDKTEVATGQPVDK